MKLSLFPQQLLSVLFLLVLSSSCLAATDDDSENLFKQGNEAYSRGKFSAAAEFYEQLTATSGYGAGVLFNLGNSYAQSGQTGKAILNYERALRLAPSNSDIQSNLELIRKESGLFPKEYSWSEHFFQLFNLDQWTGSAFFFLLIFTAFQVVSLKHRFSAHVRWIVTAACITFFTLSLSGVFSRHHQWQPSVVTDDDSRLLLSPFNSSASTGSIQQGRLVYPEKKHGDFSYVVDETGRKGWIVSSAIESVL